MREWYVYELRDPREGKGHAVFYVGKGVGDRLEAHEADDSRKGRRIREIQQAGFDPLRIVVARVEDERTALELEALLIHWVYDVEQLTNEASGHHAEHVRPYGHLGVIGGLDVPSGKGAYSAIQTARQLHMRIPQRLKELADALQPLKPEPRNHGGTPCLEVHYSQDFNLRLMVRSRRIGHVALQPGVSRAGYDALRRRQDSGFRFLRAGYAWLEERNKECRDPRAFKNELARISSTLAAAGFPSEEFVVALVDCVVDPSAAP